MEANDYGTSDRSRAPNERSRARLQRSIRSEHVEAAAFLHAIVEAANRLRAARDFSGNPALRFDSRWRLFRAIERCGGCPTFTDVSKAMRMRRQSVRGIVLAAERAGEVELFPDFCDRRSIQIALTPSGRRALERDRMPDLSWTFTLLNGLDAAAMRSTAHVLHVIAQRLENYERNMKLAAAPGRPGRRGGR